MYSFQRGRRRITKTLALAATAAAIGAPAAHAGEFVPGVTDFPSRTAHVQPAAYVPGVTDFPSRLGEQAEQAARVRVARAEAVETPAAVAADGNGFDWGAAVIGVGIGAGAMLLAALALRTRPLAVLARGH